MTVVSPSASVLGVESIYSCVFLCDTNLLCMFCVDGCQLVFVVIDDVVASLCALICLDFNIIRNYLFLSSSL